MCVSIVCETIATLVCVLHRYNAAVWTPLKKRKTMCKTAPSYGMSYQIFFPRAVMACPQISSTARSVNIYELRLCFAYVHTFRTKSYISILKPIALKWNRAVDEIWGHAITARGKKFW